MRCLQIHICKLPTKSPSPIHNPQSPIHNLLSLDLYQNGKTSNINWKLYTLYCTLANGQQKMDKIKNKHKKNTKNTKKPSPPSSPLSGISFFFWIWNFNSLQHSATPTHKQQSNITKSSYFTLNHFLNYDKTFPGDTTITTITTINHET